MTPMHTPGRRRARAALAFFTPRAHAGRHAATASVSLAALALASLAALALAGCARHDASSSSSGDAAAPVAVATFTVGGASAGAELVFPGRVTAREEVTLTARVAAPLTRLPVREGGRFRAGQALALFDAPETRRATEAAHEAVRAAALRRDLARLQEARMESLFTARVASQRERELAQAERRDAESEHAQAAAAEAQWAAGSVIPAPFAGVVVRRRVDEGATVAPGTPLLDLRSDAAGEVEVPLPESAVEAAQGARAFVQVGDGPWRQAKLARLDGMTDYATRTRTAHLAPLAGAALEPGAYARARFDVATHAPGRTAASAPRHDDGSSPSSSSLLVPAKAVVRRGALAGVFVIRDGVAGLRWLRLGRAGGDSVEVLAGLWAGEQVALAPGALSDGLRVRVAR
ncbi:MAG: efflux RND transporter periplasmic adaptor subunit [Candidatus Eisenbacteria bacterium]|nr:efflux RND transporter periplasmic adaptor subunit [Candidatus Eisenbacteria bacterium]